MNDPDSMLFEVCISCYSLYSSEDMIFHFFVPKASRFSLSNKIAFFAAFVFLFILQEKIQERQIF
uniref:Putative ovule protein n=1 Tax=Solanum chacoense TaxID=4108 RepID=A0A0V0GKS6_SOLCH